MEEIDWYNNLSESELMQLDNIYKLGIFGHDQGVTEEDIKYLYNEVHKL